MHLQSQLYLKVRMHLAEAMSHSRSVISSLADSTNVATRQDQGIRGGEPKLYSSDKDTDSALRRNLSNMSTAFEPAKFRSSKDSAHLETFVLKT